MTICLVPGRSSQPPTDIAATCHARGVSFEGWSIRRLERRDEDAWRGLWDAYLDFYRAEIPPEVTAATFTRLCSDGGDLVGYVAADESDTPVGFAHVVFHPSTWSGTSYCYLEDLYVAPSARGGDTARRLIAKVYEEADRRSSTRVYWITQEYNAPARSLYDTVAHRASFAVYER